MIVDDAKHSGACSHLEACGAAGVDVAHGGRLVHDALVVLVVGGLASGGGGSVGLSRLDLVVSKVLLLAVVLRLLVRGSACARGRLRLVAGSSLRDKGTEGMIQNAGSHSEGTRDAAAQQHSDLNQHTMCRLNTPDLPYTCIEKSETKDISRETENCVDTKRTWFAVAVLGVASLSATSAAASASAGFMRTNWPRTRGRCCANALRDSYRVLRAKFRFCAGQ